jgi:hypothetical protein
MSRPILFLVLVSQSTSESECSITTDGKSASLSWNKAPIWGLRPDFCYYQTVAGFLMWGAVSDERAGSVVYNCSWPSSAQSVPDPSSVGPVTIFYCLRFETPLFVASYDSLGYGGGIRFLIYDWTNYIVSRRTHRKHIQYPAMDMCEPHRKHRFLSCCIYSALHRNGSYPIVACVFVVAYCCRLYLATGCLPRICLR